MQIKYESWNPNEKSLGLVVAAKEIIDDYMLDGYTLTLRQLYYQFVSKGIIPNTERSYKNLGTLVTKARMAGMISWRAIEDRNRSHRGYWFEESEAEVIRETPYGIRYDQWSRQDTYVEVWVEKEALGNVISRACDKYNVPHLACKGYLSASEAWRAGQRFTSKINEGKRAVVLHLGDHDPSGIDMSRDNEDRLRVFTDGYGVELRRLALNMDQVDQYDPPPNPAKVTDSRSGGYISKFGDTSWELDALEPSVIEKLITDEVEGFIDMDIWEAVEKEESVAVRRLKWLVENWDEIKLDCPIEE